MRYTKHDGKQLDIRWYSHRVKHQDGTYEVLAASRVKGHVGRVSYRLRAPDGAVLQASSDDIQAVRIV